jgi:hypothetical protein
MKKICILLIAVFLFWGCAGPGEDGSVVVDGPVLESMNKDGNLEFNGVVVNSGDKPVHSVYVVIMLRDESGQIIESNSTAILGGDPEVLLYPSERAFFTLSVKSDPQTIASKDVEIYYDDVNSDLPPSS